MIMIRLIRWVERRRMVGNVILGVVALVLFFGIGRLVLMGING